MSVSLRTTIADKTGVSRSGLRLFKIFVQRRVKQLPHLRVIKIVERDQHYARINSFFDRLAHQVTEHSLHSEVAHPHGVLQHDTVNLFIAQAVDKSFARIEPDEYDFARAVYVLQAEQHPRGRGLVRSKDALDVIAVAIEQVLARSLRGVAR